MKKLLIILVVIFLVLVGYYFLFYNKTQKIDCDNFGVVYLKPSELQYASALANKINGIVVIPELNQIIGRTEILDCPFFDYSNYIN